MSALAAFSTPVTSFRDRLTDFIAWGRPGGSCGINTHADGFVDTDPWYAWSPSFAGTANSIRTALVRSEYLGADARALTRPWNPESRPHIVHPERLISTKWFVRFCKAYLNLIAHFKGTREAPKATIRALSAFEGALRDLGLSDKESLEEVHQGVFARAAEILARSKITNSVKYDVGRELEILAGLLQSGYHSKSLRLDGFGFRLVRRAFTFKSPFRQQDRLRARILDADQVAANQEKRVSNEVIAAIGQSYRKSVARYGREHRVTGAAALIGLPFTTTSMRLSDLLQLRADCLKFHEDADRWRISIYRPKVNCFQEVPIPKKLAPLAVELLEVVKRQSQAARDAFDFYITRYGDDFEAIDELFIPGEWTEFFKKEYAADMSQDRIKKQTKTRAGFLHEAASASVPPIPAHVLSKLNSRAGVRAPGDVQGKASFSSLYLTAAYVRRLLKFNRAGCPEQLTKVPDHVYISDQWLFARLRSDRARASESLLASLHFLYACEGEPARLLYRISELKKLLLKEFKTTVFAHWPFTSSDRNLKLNEALAVGFALRGAPHMKPDVRTESWFMPRALDSRNVLVWCDGRSPAHPRLFELLDIKLADGSYPCITLQESRQYIQTQALLAGVHETFIDELAGRQSGRQSDHYDMRTPDEIVKSSIELFDPSDPLAVAGPAAVVAKRIPIADRNAFLFSNAAPKQLTEVGGCSTSWTMSPCHKHGNCMRCESAVWRKGDQKRIPIIRSLRDHSTDMIAKGEILIERGGAADPIRRHIRQHEDVLARCNSILAVEADQRIAIGSLVTFEAPEGATGSDELVAQLRAQALAQDWRNDGDAED